MQKEANRDQAFLLKLVHFKQVTKYSVVQKKDFKFKKKFRSFWLVWNGKYFEISES